MTIVRIGASKKYSDNWQAAFGGKRSVKAAATASRSKKSAAKKTSKKSAKSRKR